MQNPKTKPLDFMMRVGFLPRSEEAIPDDPLSWAIEQLHSQDIAQMPEEWVDGRPKLVPIPDRYGWTQKTRLENVAKLDQAIKASRREHAKSSQFVRDKAKFEILTKYDCRWIDLSRMNMRSVYGTDTVRQRFGHFWFNHFTIGSFPAFRTAGDLFESRILPGLEGQFSDLLYSAISHSSMLIYLDNVNSVSPDSKEGRDRRRAGKHVGLNDNLARELLELHSCSPLANYTEADIHNTARVLAGWGVGELNSNARRKLKSVEEPFIAVKSDPGTKLILGKEYGRGPGALKSLTKDLSERPETRRYISRKLATHFISDNPSKRVTDAIESTWRDTSGNLQKVHEKVLELAWHHGEYKLLWPSHWLYNIVRFSGSDYFLTPTQITNFKLADDDAGVKFRELGNCFWMERQPNGFSLQSSDWVSSEHLDRRIRFAMSVKTRCWDTDIALKASKNLRLSKDMVGYMSRFDNATEQFVSLCTNQWLMGVHS